MRNQYIRRKRPTKHNLMDEKLWLKRRKESDRLMKNIEVNLELMKLQSIALKEVPLPETTLCIPTQSD